MAVEDDGDASASVTTPVTFDAAEKTRSSARGLRSARARRADARRRAVRCVLADGDDVGGRLAPGQLVGMVLERPHEHDGTRPSAQLQDADEPSIAPVAPDPQKTTTSSSPPPTARARSGGRPPGDAWSAGQSRRPRCACCVERQTASRMSSSTNSRSGRRRSSPRRRADAGRRGHRRRHRRRSRRDGSARAGARAGAGGGRSRSSAPQDG